MVEVGRRLDLKAMGEMQYIALGQFEVGLELRGSKVLRAVVLKTEG